jgi:hypothetical protein
MLDIDRSWARIVSKGSCTVEKGHGGTCSREQEYISKSTHGIVGERPDTVRNTKAALHIEYEVH